MAVCSRTVFLWCFLHVLILHIHGCLCQTVDITNGRIEGISGQLGGKSITKYLGIPYAKPPVGVGRFVAPEEPEPWVATLDVKAYKPFCLQSRVKGVNLTMDEDCLYMNIFVPDGFNLSVMMWLHSGGYQNGLMSEINPAILAVSGQIIVVTFNYRISVFGDFSTGDDLVEGNAGPMDQVMALQWIQDNIEYFGGDKTKVTIFGVGMGARRVNFHMASPMSLGLFQRAIVMGSSVIGVPLDTVSERGATGKKLASLLNCPINSSSELLMCMQKISASDILAFARTQPERQTMNTLGAATIGGRFLPTHPDNTQSDVDLIAGFTSEMIFHQKMIIFSPEVTTNVTNYLNNGFEEGDPLYNKLSEIALTSVEKGLTLSSDNAIWQALKDQYLSEVGMSPQRRLRVVCDMNGAVLYLRPITQMLRDHSSGRGKSYMYIFDQKLPQLNPNPFQSTEIVPSFQTFHEDMPLGALEGSDLFYVFGQVSSDVDPDNVINGQMDSENINVGAAMMSAWVTFAKTGNPTFTTENGEAIEWPEYEGKKSKYMEFKYPMDSSSIKEHFLPSDTSFVTKLLPAFMQSFKRAPHTPYKKECEKERSVSTVSRDKAETAMFILSAVVIVLLLNTGVITMNYFTLKKELKK